MLYEFIAWTLSGFDNFLVDLVLERDFAETLLDKITDYQIRVAQRYVKLGVACGRTGDDYGGKAGMLFSPAMWREFIKPRLKRAGRFIANIEALRQAAAKYAGNF